MSIACPDCGRTEGLRLVRRLVLPGDRRSDEISLEVLACPCGFKALAVAEQARQTSLRNADPERVVYRLPPAAVDLIDFLMAQCPSPAEEYCTCPAHTALNRRDLRNQWNLLHSFAPFHGFALPQPPAAAGRAELSHAPIDWARNGSGYCADVDGRSWHLHVVGQAGAPSYELTIDDALGIEFDAWPPFWHAPAA
jgi:hypothetical protein